MSSQRRHRPPWLLALMVAWAFLSVEIGFHANLLLHYDALSWRSLDVLNNRPAYAVALLAGLAFCYSETSDFFTRMWMWVPVGATLFLVAIPSADLWNLVVQGDYPGRAEYASGQWAYTVIAYYPATVFTDNKLAAPASP